MKRWKPNASNQLIKVSKKSSNWHYRVQILTDSSCKKWHSFGIEFKTRLLAVWPKYSKIYTSNSKTKRPILLKSRKHSSLYLQDKTINSTLSKISRMTITSLSPKMKICWLMTIPRNSCIRELRIWKMICWLLLSRRKKMRLLREWRSCPQDGWSLNSILFVNVFWCLFRPNSTDMLHLKKYWRITMLRNLWQIPKRMNLLILI